jgi:AcrR family transcriptional regulator
LRFRPTVVVVGVTAAPGIDETTGRRPSRRGDEARAAIVAAAEHLFAVHGIAAVSLRDVSAAAGQKNHSAAQYHFGDRHGLVAAVYVAHMSRVDDRRRQLLAERSAGGIAAGRDGLEPLVHAVVLPLVEEVTTSGGWYARFLVRTRWDPVALDVVAELETTTGLVAIWREMIARLADLSLPVRRSRLDQLLNLIISTLATWEWAHDRGEPRLSPDALVRELTATGTAVLLARAIDPIESGAST